MIYRNNHGKELMSYLGKSNHCFGQTLLFCHHSQFVCLFTIFLNLPVFLSEAIDTYFPLSCRASGFSFYISSTVLLYTIAYSITFIQWTFVIISVVPFLGIDLLIYPDLILILFRYNQLLISGNSLGNTEIMARRVVVKLIQTEITKTTLLPIITLKNTYRLMWESELKMCSP